MNTKDNLMKHINTKEMVFQDMPKEENTNFIWGDFINEQVIDDLTHLVNEEPYYLFTMDGRSNRGVDKNIKDSTDTYLPLLLNHPAIQNYLTALQEVLEKYLDKFPWAGAYEGFKIKKEINYQWYAPGGGFKVWHTERSGSSSEDQNRHLVYMTYLNDVPDGGTDWFHQSLYVPAQKGYTVIWPADWTHTHRGHVSETSEKAIVTGWYEFT